MLHFHHGNKAAGSGSYFRQDSVIRLKEHRFLFCNVDLRVVEGACLKRIVCPEDGPVLM
jgi:hypothetical protein